ncbi:unnamed protein product [Arctia plantaginis]|uniref:Uncharacterized protein n=1 Tax=Arctia plantaginis TaxID=874455 RepID=A0A8S0Z5N9_ARCPL|nr:unnamed protein product [Arctia plantaginis]
MNSYVAGFIVALILALLVIAWITYCMFVKEKHKSEFYHHNISDLQRRNEILGQVEETAPQEKEIDVGTLVLPSRHENKDEESEKRLNSLLPSFCLLDIHYPESTIHISTPITEKLMEILDDGDTDANY